MTKIHREIHGHGGQPLVMLHGWAMHSGVWREFAKQLASARQVICLDLPGHGHSEPLAGFTLENIAEVLHNAVPEKKFSLLGWSLGGMVAIEMAHRFPRQVDSLFILAGNPKFVQSNDWAGVRSEVLDGFAALLAVNTRQTLIRFLALQVNGLPDGKHLLHVLKHAVMECDPPSPETLQAALKILKQQDLREKLRSIRCPVTLIQGDKDTLIPLASGLALQRLMPGVKLKILEQAGHVPFLSHSGQLLELLNPANAARLQFG